MFPASVTLDPEPFRTHWVFCWVPEPGAMEPAGAAPASVSKMRELAAGIYVIEQAFVVLEVELNSTETAVKSVAPATSEN